MSAPSVRMSQRESEVLAALGQHLSNAQIASRLHLSVRTVETHVSSLLRKLDAPDRRALAVLAPSLLTEPPDSLPDPARVLGRPSAWTPFLGRTSELGTLRAALLDSPLVTVLGPGGVGKTRLAAHVADDVAPSFPLGCAFVDLVGVRPGFLVQAVATVLRVSERPGQPLGVAVMDRLRPGRSLLVLDNCEHLLDDVASFVGQLLGLSSGVHVLATSRERLGIPLERVVPLAGMAVAPGNGTGNSEAVTLFLDRARSVDPDFDPDPTAVEELCDRLDGMPLAIELAAARTASLGMAGLSAGLADRLRLLAGGRGPDQRHRSMRAVIDWSYDLLEPDEAAAFRRLGVFACDFDIAAAAAVADMSPAAVADVVGRLADKSLLTRRVWSSGSRWYMLDTVRDYAADKARSAGEEADLRRRHLGWAVEAAAGLESRLEGGDPWRAEFDLVVDDLRAAVEGPGDVPAEGDRPAVHRVARALGHLTYAARFLEESRRHYEAAAALAPDAASAARDLWASAEVAHVEDRGAPTFRMRLAAAERAAVAGDHVLEASVLAEAVAIGTRFPALFDEDVPLDELVELLARAERVAPPDDSRVGALIASARAWNELRSSETPRIEPFARAVSAARATDDPVLISAALDAIGCVWTIRGDFRRTDLEQRERSSQFERLPGHAPRTGAEIHDLVHMSTEVAVTVGDIPTALADALRFNDEVAIASTPYMAASKTIVPLALLGRFDEVLAAAERATQAWERAGSPPARWLAPPVYAAALACGLRGRLDEAERWRRYALDRVAGVQSRTVHFHVGGFARFADARIALHAGDLDSALRAVADIPSGPDAWKGCRHWYFDAYPWALAAEVAVVAGRSDAEDRIAAARSAADQNDWAAACLARVLGRATGDPDALAEAVARWEGIGARFERAVTLLLIEGREAEGLVELETLGCPAPFWQRAPAPGGTLAGGVRPVERDRG